MENKEFQITFEFVNGSTSYAVVKGLAKKSVLDKIKRDQWIQDERTGAYYNFDKVISFSIQPLDQ